MARSCTGCGGGGAPRRGIPQTIEIANANAAAFVRVEYLGTGKGNRTYKVNGSAYTLSAGTNKIIPVRETDVAALSSKVSIGVIGPWGDEQRIGTGADLAAAPVPPAEDAPVQSDQVPPVQSDEAIELPVEPVVEDEVFEPAEPFDFSALNGIGKKLAERLHEAGVVTADDFLAATPEDLADITDKGDAQAAAWADELSDILASD